MTLRCHFKLDRLGLDSEESELDSHVASAAGPGLVLVCRPDSPGGLAAVMAPIKENPRILLQAITCMYFQTQRH